MSSYYQNVYRRRLNRYGMDYQSRVQSQRERDFDNYLYKSVYRVDFEYEGDLVPGSLEHSKQNYSETQAYLLTRIDLDIPNGTVLMIQSQDGSVTPWMTWWLEHVEAGGYNRYIVLQMTHFLKWKLDESEVQQWAFFSGPGTAAISDTTRSSTAKPLYSENNNLYTFITAYHPSIVRDLYFDVEIEGIKLGYVVTGVDAISTSGVVYVTVDPVPVREEVAKPTQNANDKKEDFFWLQGGVQ